MKGILKINAVRLNFTEKQPCVKAIRKANLPESLKNELWNFIKRNILPDCGRVSPNCLKAHMIATAKNLGFDDEIIKYLKNLFAADVGYKGYYLDEGKLKRV